MEHWLYMPLAGYKNIGMRKKKKLYLTVEVKQLLIIADYSGFFHPKITVENGIDTNAMLKNIFK